MSAQGRPTRRSEFHVSTPSLFLLLAAGLILLAMCFEGTQYLFQRIDEFNRAVAALGGRIFYLSWLAWTAEGREQAAIARVNPDWATVGDLILRGQASPPMWRAFWE